MGQYTGDQLMLAIILVSVSLFCCSLLIYLVFKSKRLRDSHPNKHIALLAICQFICIWHAFVWQVNQIQFFCYFNLVGVHKALARPLEYMGNFFKAKIGSNLSLEEDHLRSSKILRYLLSWNLTFIQML